MKRIAVLCLAVLFLGAGLGCKLNFDFTIAGFYHPAYLPGTAIPDSALLGTWEDVSGEDFGTVEFKAEDYGLMRMTLVLDDEGREIEALFHTALFTSRGNTYLDAIPYALEGDDHTIFRSLMSVTTHGVFKVVQTDGGYDMLLLDPLALAEELEADPGLLAHLRRGEDDPYILVTASTEDIQAYLARAEQTPSAFMEFLKLRRPQAD